MTIKKRIDIYLNRLFNVPAEKRSPGRYSRIRRNIIIFMTLATALPLSSLVAVNFYQHRKSMEMEILTPITIMGNRSRSALEIFLESRFAAVRFVASAYSFEELARREVIDKVFSVMKNSLGGFIDLGLIDEKGIMVSYSGPYTLLGNDYSSQRSFRQALVKGTYVSEVFKGFRDIPHVVITVRNLAVNGEKWVLRATIDTDKFDAIIASVDLDPLSDIFLVNRKGVLQTRSRYHGDVLDTCSFDIPKAHGVTRVVEREDMSGRKRLVAFIGIRRTNFTLVMVIPGKVAYKNLQALRSDVLMFFILGLAFIALSVTKLSDILVNNIKTAEEKREEALAELQHSQKLSSIGRLAAGVAHEINNPLAIINEKAGLMNDYLGCEPEFQKKQRFVELIGSILNSVDRCSSITHRLLGFARRLDVKMEPVDVNKVIVDVLGFVEREAGYRNIDLRLDLQDEISSVLADYGQLQQVVLNLLTNAFSAVDEGGVVSISSSQRGGECVVFEVRDNGSGMTQETLKRIFEPFYTTKEGVGTGLGLSITYGIIKKFGGDISVESFSGQGSVFKVILPYRPDSMEESDEKN